MKLRAIWLLAAGCLAVAPVGCAKPQSAESGALLLRPKQTAAPQNEAETTAPPTVARLCPDFSYRLLDGTTVTRDSFKGKHALIYVTSYT